MNLIQLIDVLANRKLHKRLKFRGLDISIENRAGSVRRGINSYGKPWATKLSYDYGYIRNSVGTDGDHVDCFIGPNENAEKVYVIHIQDPKTKKYDEDKAMIGWNSAKEAKKAMLDNYDNPAFFQSMDEMNFEKFKVKVLATKNKPMKLVAGWR